MKERLLRAWARFAATHPWLVIVCVLVITILAALSASRNRMDMRWSDLLPMGDPVAQEFDRILKEYRSASTIHIVVKGKEQQMKQFAEVVAPRLEQLTDYIERVDYKMEQEFFAEHGFMLAKATDLEKTKDMFLDLNLIPLMKGINDNFEEEYVGDEEALRTKEKEDEAVRFLDGLHFWIQALDRSLDNPDGTAYADSAVEYLLYGDPYFLSYDKRILLIALKPTFTSIDIEKDIAATVAIQQIIDDTIQDFPGLYAGLTGIIPLQKDEMEHTTKDMRMTSIVALVLVLALFILTFRMWSTPILAALNLIIAIIIAAGIVGVTIGRLNIMTSMFGVILIGLGIDYAIHIISVYAERRSMHSDAATAMEETFVRSGAGIITGALTTAAAFFALAVSVTQGIREMGIVLGIGIICAMVISMTLLPALLVARERVLARVSRKPSRPPHVEFTILGRYGEHVMRRPLLYLLITCALTAFFLYQALNIRFDYNMYNVEPVGLETVALQDTIIDAFDLSPDFAMVTASSIEESYDIAEKAREMPSFSAVENIGDFCPPIERQHERRPYVLEIRQGVESRGRQTRLTVADVDNLIEQLVRLDMNIYELSQLAFLGGQDKVDAKCQSIVGNPEADKPDNDILNLVDKIHLNPQHAVQALNTYQEHYFPVLRTKVYNMANPEFITLDNLPDHIKERYVNDAGDMYLVTLYPREQIWDFEVMRRFDAQLALVHPRITGTPPLFLRLINYVARDGLIATVLTIVIVMLLLWFDFRSFRMALLGVVPLLAGGIWMVGILKSLGMMLNFINVMGLPMIVGIGIDDGVHLLHRYQYEGLRKTPLVLKSTGKAILLTSLTTMAGFGSLSLASYRGWASLGILLAVGVGACFVTTVLFLPAIISLTQRNRPTRALGSDMK
jgi:hopanoid biosynthesis associated RND transporter like protein HpnN